MQNSGDNTNSDIIITNDINNENFAVTQRQESDEASDCDVQRGVRPLEKSPESANGTNPSNGFKDVLVFDTTVTTTAKKSSDRNAINFMVKLYVFYPNHPVLGYFLLVLIVIYGYFGSLISDYISNSSQTPIANNNRTQTLRSETNSTNSVTKGKKFYNTITSTELIVILWLTLIYGSALLLYLRFKILRLERDPNKPKKKKDSTEELNLFLTSNRRNKRSFKQKVVNNEQNVNDNSDQPFWQK